MEKQIEVVGIFNHTKITLEDAEVLSRSVFKGINVNNCILVCHSDRSNEALADLIARIKKHTLMFMIQESYEELMKLTFVTSISWRVFLKLLYHQRDLCEEIYKCRIFIDEI